MKENAWLRFLLKIVLLCLLALLVLVSFYLGAQSIRLNWWSSAASVGLPDLTPDQKAADMGYLLDLLRQVSAADAAWQVAGLDNPLDQPAVWIERARQTPSNSAFADLVLQLLVHAGQVGHAYLAYDVNFNPVTSLVSAIPRDAFARMPQWAALIGQLPWNAHADLDLVYRNGEYVLARAAEMDDVTIPAGAAVETVDGLFTDTFVLQQQYRAHLRYDPTLRKFFLYPLFIVDPGADRPGWDVTFRLPDGARRTVFVPKIPGYVAHRPDESQSVNTRCLALNDDVLYVRMRTFHKTHVAQDGVTLRKCFASDSFRKAILDVRGNTGGEVWSYTDNIIALLISQPITYEMTSAVKDSFYEWYGWRFGLFRATNDNELTDPPAHVVHVKEIAYPPYSDHGWRVVRVSRRIEPGAEPFLFAGQVYVLTDNNTLSAGDSFAAAMQNTGLAKVVGANTAGWGQSYQIKMPYALPNSGLIIFLDAELTLNSDGTLNNYIGVIPDVLLSGSTYPTPYPDFDRAAILEDDWVRWVLADGQQE